MHVLGPHPYVTVQSLLGRHVSLCDDRFAIERKNTYHEKVSQYIHVCMGLLQSADRDEVCTLVKVTNVMNCAIFGAYKWRGMVSSKGKIYAFFLRKLQMALTTCFAP